MLSNKTVIYNAEVYPYDKVVKLLREDGMNLKNVDTQDSYLCKIAVKQTGHALQYARRQTLKLCETAYNKNPMCEKYIEPRFREKVLFGSLPIYHLLLMAGELKREKKHKDMIECCKYIINNQRHQISKKMYIKILYWIQTSYKAINDEENYFKYLKMAVDEGCDLFSLTILASHYVDKDKKIGN